MEKLKMEKEKDMVLISIEMEISLLENGKMMKSYWESIFSVQEKSFKESLRVEKLLMEP